MKARSKGAAGTAGGDKSVFILIFFLLFFVVAMAAIYGYVAIQDGYDKQYITLLGEQRVLSQQITKYAGQTSQGTAAVFSQLKKSHESFRHSFMLLKEGDPETGMPPTPVEVLEALQTVETEWRRFDRNVTVILSREQAVRAMRETVQAINERAAQLLALSDEVATLMAQRGAESGQVYIASRQLMLSQRIVNNVNRVLEGGEGAVTAADRFGRDAALFGRVIRGLLEGNRGLGIERVSNNEIRTKLGEVNTLFDEIGAQVSAILERSPEMFEVSEAVQEVLTHSDRLLNAISTQEEAYQTYTTERKLNTAMGNLFGLVALLLLFYLGYSLRKEGNVRVLEADSQRVESEEQNRRNQQAIMRLLDEMGDLADGDLTVNATVTEDITGAIADSMNYAIDALRTLVTAINETASQVSAAAQQTQATAIHLAEASDHQAQQIASASGAVNEMAISIEGVSRNADQLAEEAQLSVDIAAKGTAAVQKTIEGMDSIREQIQETSKRIKRLGESSQEIGDIVELINDIAEQTNILALNAAIQAAMAGEAGRGFAVVADEVQRLAERSADATKQIEALVKTIQADTNEAVISMEQSTAGVVNGARLAEDAGTALGEIENVSMHLAELVQSISGATRQQAAAAANVSDTMNVIQEITTQTSAGTTHTAAAIGNLAELADDLKKSVSGFKLPG
ncbi:MAG: chemotaxis protein [Gammaproteobacteria bacterium HGW-Gammaproteobacteria-1]|jgi:twitching motility protein PilJ|nr:MAG: chemotaxis protein [Gammaproteobacteria bacterium HGW-Gammaproteobacteria-1]